MSEIERTPRFVVVELFDDSAFDAQFVAGNIVAEFGDRVKQAQPAYDDGFGRIVLVGRAVES